MKTLYIRKALTKTKKAGHAAIREVFALRYRPTAKKMLEIKAFRRKGVTFAEFEKLVLGAQFEAQEKKNTRIPARSGTRNFMSSGKMDFPCLGYRQKQIAKGLPIQKRWENQLISFDPTSKIDCLLSASHTDADANKITWQNKKENCSVQISVKFEKYSRACLYQKSIYSYSINCHPSLRKAPSWVRANAGMIALWAEKQFEENGEECWAAKWVRKGQGISLVTEDGFILQRGNQTAHGKTIAACRGVLKRRETEKGLEKKESRLMQMLQDNNPNGYSNISVRISDSIKAGNCQQGTLAFRDRFFPGQESATVSEILQEAKTFSERDRAIAACARAIRTSKKIKETA
jgi:hypothetical protein